MSLTPEVVHLISEKLGDNHIMLSYQWGVQDIVKLCHGYISSKGINVWMDIMGGVSGDINAAMAHGVENAKVIVPFMTEKYQASASCQHELSYAKDLQRKVVPIMAQRTTSSGGIFRATDWLGLITAGKLWVDFRDAVDDHSMVPLQCDQLLKEIANFLDDTKGFKAPIPPIPEPKPSPAKPQLPAGIRIGQQIRLRSINYPKHTIRKLSSGRTAIALPGSGSEMWIVRSGLSGEGYSLESADGGFLRHRDFVVIAEPFSDDPVFRADATFTFDKSRSGRGVTIRSVNFPDHVVRHSSSVLWLHDDDEDQSNLMTQDSSFTVEAPEVVELRVGQTVRLRSVNFQKHTIRKLGSGRTAISKHGDEMWEVRSGLSGKGISLESSGGGFLRHRSGEVHADPSSNSNLFKEDASFTVEKGHAGSGITLRSVNYPNHIIRHSNYVLWISKDDKSDLLNKDSSFNIEDQLIEH